MKRYRGFELITAVVAAARCWDAGATVKDIAAQAHVSPATIRRWLHMAERKLGRRKKP